MYEEYRSDILLRLRDCDMNGFWRPSAILEAMQETGGDHTAFYRLTFNDLREMNLAWIISRVKVVFSRVPKIGETITVETYPCLEKRMFFPRIHRFLDANGKEIGAGSGLWLLFDLTKRRITINDEVVGRLPEHRDQKALLFAPESVKPLDAEARINLHKPQFCDFDLNGHVNNTKYMDWCMNEIGMEKLKTACVSEFNICYEAEIASDEALSTELRIMEEAFTYTGQAEGKRKFSISGKLSRI